MIDFQEWLSRLTDEDLIALSNRIDRAFANASNKAQERSDQYREKIVRDAIWLGIMGREIVLGDAYERWYLNEHPGHHAFIGHAKIRGADLALDGTGYVYFESLGGSGGMPTKVFYETLEEMRQQK